MSQILILSTKFELLVLPINLRVYISQQMNVTISVPANTWRYLNFDNQLAVRKRCHTACLHARSSLLETIHTAQLCSHVLRTMLPLRIFSHFGNLPCSCCPPHPNSKEILQRFVTSFVRDCRSELEVIVVNCSVSHLTSNV